MMMSVRCSGAVIRSHGMLAVAVFEGFAYMYTAPATSKGPSNMTRDAMKLLAGYYEKWRKTSMLCNNACRR